MAEIDCDWKGELSIPDDVDFVSVMLTVELDPPNARCIIYGWQENGDLGFTIVTGAKSEIDFPIVRRFVYVKFPDGIQNYSISVRGWTEVNP